MLNVGFIKQNMDGEGVLSSVFNLVDFQSLLKSRSIKPSPQIIFLYKMHTN